MLKSRHAVRSQLLNSQGTQKPSGLNLLLHHQVQHAEHVDELAPLRRVDKQRGVEEGNKQSTRAARPRCT